MYWLSQWCDRDIATQPPRVHCVFHACVDRLSVICDRDYATPQSLCVFSACLSQWWMSLPNQCPVCVFSACVDWVWCERERTVIITATIEIISITHDVATAQLESPCVCDVYSVYYAVRLQKNTHLDQPRKENKPKPEVLHKNTSLDQPRAQH